MKILKNMIQLINKIGKYKIKYLKNKDQGLLCVRHIENSIEERRNVTLIYFKLKLR